MAYQGILDSCNDCNVCVEECLFLRKYALTPLQAVLENEARTSGTSGPAGEHATDVAFACLLCGLCDSVCPSQLSPSGAFASLRARSVQHSAAISACKPFFSDRKYNLYTIYRSANSIDYADMFRAKAKTVLFPGCSLGTFFPRLTKALYDNLSRAEPELGLLMECCHKPLKDLGLGERYESASARLAAALDEMGVEKIITACPSCLAVLRERFKGREVVSCYSMIRPESDEVAPLSVGSESARNAESFPRGDSRVKVTVHDSCSDREYGIVGPEVRGLLSRTGSVEMVEMVHTGRNSLCCGSGGLVPAFDPKLASDVNRERIGEAEASGAEMMVTYCATCANAFRSGGNPSKIEVRHALELLLGVREDYESVRRNLDALFVSGPRKDLYKRMIEHSP